MLSLVGKAIWVLVLMSGKPANVIRLHKTDFCVILELQNNQGKFCSVFFTTSGIRGVFGWTWCWDRLRTGSLGCACREATAWRQLDASAACPLRGVAGLRQTLGSNRRWNSRPERRWRSSFALWGPGHSLALGRSTNGRTPGR